MAIDWNLGSRDRDPKPHWASEPASNCVALGELIPMALGLDEELGVASGDRSKPR